MVRDPFIQKAWELRHQAARSPLEVLLKAVVWLEEKHRKTPNQQWACAIALHYYLLALRQASASPATAKEYFSRAERWREEVTHEVPVKGNLD